jgi:hypothetical protein
MGSNPSVNTSSSELRFGKRSSKNEQAKKQSPNSSEEEDMVGGRNGGS